MKFGPRTTVRELRAGEKGTPVERCELVLEEIKVRTVSNGSSLTICTLKDRTGIIQGKCWDDRRAEWGGHVDQVVAVTGELGSYNRHAEISVRSLSPVSNPDAGKFHRFSGERLAALYGQLQRAITTVGHPEYRKILNYLYPDIAAFDSQTDQGTGNASGNKNGADGESARAPGQADALRRARRFVYATGAVRHHHNYRGGLLEHTLGVTNACAALAQLYPFTDRDLLITSALVHDIGKIDNYEVGSMDSIKMTDRGRLLEHIVMGVQTLDEAVRESGAKLSDDDYNRLYHCVLAHQGKLEWASPVTPKLFEAFLLHIADLVDSRTRKVLTAMESDAGGEDWVHVDTDMGRFARFTPPDSDAGEDYFTSLVERFKDEGGSSAPDEQPGLFDKWVM